MKKVCSKCGTISERKHGTICQPCRNKAQRKYRKRVGNLSTHIYERLSYHGFLMRVYRNMLSRVRGIAPRGRTRYEGLPILSREAFYEWAIRNRKFKRLFTEWHESGMKRRLVPSIDRKNANGGYVRGNLRWLTLSENARLGGRAK